MGLLAVVCATAPSASAETPFVLLRSQNAARIRLVTAAENDVAEVDDAEIPPAPATELEDEPIVTRPIISGTAITLEGPRANVGEKQDRSTAIGSLVFTYLPGDGDQFGLFGFEFRGPPQRHMPQASMLTAQPGWGITWLDGPEKNDLPPQLYHFAFTIGSQMEVNDELVLDLGVTPAWFTDLENRRAAWYYRLDSVTQIAAGFVYLNRDDIPALPVAGVILDSREAGRRLELVFPRPKLSWRLAQTETSSRWFSLGGELGGGSWAIKRPDRKPDVVTYRDIKLVGGIEFHGAHARRAAFEAGWVFGRAIESRTGRDDYDPPDTAMIRMWLDY
jgi:hypothetical protein